MGLELNLSSGWSPGREGRARSSRHQSFSTRISSKQSDAPGEALRSSLLAHFEPFPAKLDAKSLAELSSLREEKDPEIFYLGLLNFGQRLQDRGKIEAAAEVYSAIFQTKQDIRGIAKARLDALSGIGSVGLRAEFLLKTFAESATNYRTIVPMIAGSAVYRLAKTATLGRLASMNSVSWFNRGFGANLSSAVLGTTLEVPVFALGTRWLHQLGGVSPTRGVGEDLLGAGLTLGVLKLSGWAGQQSVQKLASVRGVGAMHVLQKFNRAVIPQASMFVGLMSAHRLEQAVGLIPHVDGATAVTDTLATMVSLGVGSHLGAKVLGPRFAQFQQKLEIQTKFHSEKNGSVGTRSANDSWRMPLPLYHPIDPRRPRHVDPQQGKWWIQLSEANDGGRGNGNRPTTTPGHRHAIREYVEELKTRFEAGDADALVELGVMAKDNHDAAWALLELGSGGNRAAVKAVRGMKFSVLPEEIQGHVWWRVLLHQYALADCPDALRILFKADRGVAEDKPWAVNDLDFLMHMEYPGAQEVMAGLNPSVLEQLASRPEGNRLEAITALLHLHKAGNPQAQPAILRIAEKNPALIPELLPHLYDDHSSIRLALKKIEGEMGLLKVPSALAVEVVPTGAGEGSSLEHELQNRLQSLPEKIVSDQVQALNQQWRQWSEKTRIHPEFAPAMEKFLASYVEFGMAYLGRDLQSHWSFVPEIFALAAKRIETDSEAGLPPGFRSLLIRFLSTQPARRSAETRTESEWAEGMPSALPPVETRALLGDLYPRWEQFLRRQIHRSPGPLLEQAQFFQRGLNLMHFYASYPQNHSGLRYRPELLAKTLGDSAHYPYPPRVVEIFQKFFQEELGAKVEEIVPAPAAEALIEPLHWDSLPLSTPALQPARPGENWAQYLSRLGTSKAILTAADLGVTGATILGWGSKVDAEGRLLVPGEVLNLLSVVTYLNSQELGGVDPLEAARLALPTQLTGWRPDAEGNVVIHYPQMLKDLHYGRFGLSALLRRYLHGTPEARDMDLADRWQVSVETVREYRRGEVRKMRLDTLQRLAKSLAPEEASPEQLEARIRLLMFLRYQPYFEAIAEIVDNEGQVLNRRPPLGSQFRIRLVPDEESLPPLELRRRIAFEREPFASAMNGGVDLALELMERRLQEYEMLGELPTSDPEGWHATLKRQLGEFRDGHARYFQLLSAQERSPAVIRPGQRREIRDFYRELFRAFELNVLHRRPRMEMKIGDNRVLVEIVPPTQEQASGVKLDAYPQISNLVHAYVVASDLVENGQSLDRSTLREILKLRVVKEVFRRENLILPGLENRGLNRDLLKSYLASTPLSMDAEELLNRFELLEWQAAQWRGIILDPSTEATIHRITRGSPVRSAAERRQLRWGEELHAFVHRRQIAALGLALQEVFSRYLHMVEDPFLNFHPERLEDALTPLQNMEGPTVAVEVRNSLLEFMRGLGLPTAKNAEGTTPELTVKGLATSALATYLRRYGALHPLKLHDQVVLDPALIEQVVEDRLVDFPQLAAHQDRVVRALTELLEDYNRRSPPLRVIELAAPEHLEREPFPEGSLVRWWSEAQERQGHRVASRVILAAVAEGGERLWLPDPPSTAELEQIYHRAEQRLSLLGLMPDSSESATAVHAFGHFVTALRARRKSLLGLETLLPDFIRSRKFHSGLEASAELGSEMAAVYRAYLDSALRETNPLALREAILGVLGERFSAYPTIREDVIRGMRGVLWEWLESVEVTYRQIAEALAMSLEEATGGSRVEKFWGDLLGLTMGIDSGLAQPHDLRQRLLDLEYLFDLMRRAPTEKLSERLETALREIEAKHVKSKSAASEKAANDLEALLAVPVPKESFEKYPELALAKEADLRKAATQLAALRGDWLKPEGRVLLQLLAMFESQEGRLTPELKTEVEALKMELATFPSEGKYSEAIHQAFQLYKEIRPRLLNQIPILEWIGTWPEVKGDGKPVPAELTGRVLQRLINSRELPPVIQWEFFRNIDWVHQRHPVDFFDHYYSQLAEFYRNHRREILKAPPALQLPEEELRPLDLNRPPARHRKWVDQEAPELDLISDSMVQEELLRRQAVSLEGPRWPEEYYYLLIKIRALEGIFLRDLKSGAFREQIAKEFNRVMLFEDRGSGEGFSPAGNVERMKAIYLKHRPQILKHLLKMVGPDAYVGVLPAIRDEPARQPFDLHEIKEKQRQYQNAA